ncbi:MAG: YicC family protein [Candidatus Omnitrophica bacterium]|nr:YicC family protein [Candidatus Omnitrophota bacterium]
MAKSMTGYGRSSAWTPIGKVEVEVKSLNHRFLEIGLKIPSHLAAFEEQLRRRVGHWVRRGKVTVAVLNDNPAQEKDLRFNPQIAEFYIRSLNRLKKRLGVRSEINLVELAQLPQVVTFSQGDRMLRKGWPPILKLVDQAFSKMEGARRREGQALARDLKAHLLNLRGILRDIERRAPQMVEAYQVRLKERVEQLSQGLGIDADRLAREVAIFAERCDISEEIIRSKSHLGAFERTLNGDDGAGRSLDFMTQELLRETNTIGSKSPDAALARRVIDLKGVLEKVREQVQNLE